MQDIQNNEDVLAVKKYQNYILNGRIMNAKKFYRELNNNNQMQNTLVSADEINILTDIILRLQRDALNRTQNWVTNSSMTEAALSGDYAWA